MWSLPFFLLNQSPIQRIASQSSSIRIDVTIYYTKAARNLYGNFLFGIQMLLVYVTWILYWNNYAIYRGNPETGFLVLSQYTRPMIQCSLTIRYCMLLSVFSQILERLMYNRLLKFLNKHTFFNKFQFGFRNKHSTFMALIILLENLVKALDDGNCAVGIFLDFQKAFDTVDHCTLLDKLHIYGIRGVAYD